MNGHDSGRLLYLLLALVIVASAFVGRRMPIAQAFKMILAWVAIFALVGIAFGFRHDIRALVDTRLLGKATVSGGTVRIPMGEDGHFHADARINGKPVRMLVDSGATVTSLSVSAAEAAGVKSSGGFPVVVETANGLIEMERGRAASFSVASIAVAELPVHISPRDDVSVLGMNFLSRLSRWSVEGGTLVLVP